MEGAGLESALVVLTVSPRQFTVAIHLSVEREAALPRLVPVAPGLVHPLHVAKLALVAVDAGALIDVAALVDDLAETVI